MEQQQEGQPSSKVRGFLHYTSRLQAAFDSIDVSGQAAAIGKRGYPASPQRGLRQGLKTESEVDLEVVGEGEVVDGGEGEGKDEDIQGFAIGVQGLCITDQLRQDGVHPVPLLRR